MIRSHFFSFNLFLFFFLSPVFLLSFPPFFLAFFFLFLLCLCRVMEIYYLHEGLVKFVFLLYTFCGEAFNYSLPFQWAKIVEFSITLIICM